MRRAVALPLALLAGAGCLWRPNIEEQGYTRCASDADCAAGRACDVGLCAPPPWNDDRFAARQLFVVENKSEAPIPKGAAVPVRVGAGGLIESGELGVDGRFTFFDRAELAWKVLPVFRDTYQDHLFAWLPLSGEVAPGGEAALGWLETQTDSNEPTLFEAPEQVFLFYDDFAGDALSEERYDVFGTGVPIVGNGRVNVADNQRLVGRLPLEPPFSLVFRGRINGATCAQLDIALTAGDEPGFPAPSVGFFSAEALEVWPQVAPTADSIPTNVSDAPVPVSTAEHRYRIDVGDGKARLWIDDEVVGAFEGRPPIEAEALHFRVQVDGACSFDVERLMVTPLPFETPEVRAEARVDYEIFD